MKFKGVYEGKIIYESDVRQSKINKSMVIKPKQTKGKTTIAKEVRGMFKQLGNL